MDKRTKERLHKHWQERVKLSLFRAYEGAKKVSSLKSVLTIAEDDNEYLTTISVLPVWATQEKKEAY